MNRLLLDTQAFIMAATEGWPDLPQRVQALLSDPEIECILSTVSVTEIAIKNSIGKLNLDAEGTARAIADLALTVVPFTPLHAYRMFNLPLHHREPFDRMLIATALHEGIPLVGGDDKFPLYESEGLQLIWK
jgi:PIN domain nuclease of toxin-antitoxin system